MCKHVAYDAMVEVENSTEGRTATVKVLCARCGETMVPVNMRRENNEVKFDLVPESEYDRS